MKSFVIAVSAAAALVLAAMFLFDAASPPKPMSGDDFARTVGAMRSIAAETALFTEQLQDDRLGATFARTHRDKLEEILDDERDKLEVTLPAELASAGERARALGKELGASMTELKRDLADRDAVGRIGGEARKIEAELKRLEHPR